ncbi:MAG: tRNA (cytidine(34)-2'-O)-methyltransferase [Phycisphaerae bacterium]|nr:tRNA (cytidine(34)-2'-O)-methyltransferase [Phycisphaerae bacterium]
MPPLFHVVLHQPEIPNNTGNIGRTCVATASSLHLIHPLGFDTSEKACRRAGLDYWPRLDLHHHASWHDYLANAEHPSLWLLSTRGSRSLFDAPLHKGDHLVFGSETAGLPATILRAHPGRVLSLPMAPGERSLNLATAVCAVLYEGLRQLIHRRDVRLSATGRLRVRPPSPRRTADPALPRPRTLSP